MIGTTCPAEHVLHKTTCLGASSSPGEGSLNRSEKFNGQE